jgi:hypothetical protein
MSTTTTKNLLALALLGDGTGYAVGEGGTILKLMGGPTALAPPSKRTQVPGVHAQGIASSRYGFMLPDGRVFNLLGRGQPSPVEPGSK